jgi:hypothetical protein
VALPVVLQAKGHLPVRQGQPAVGGAGHAVGVAAEVIEDLGRPAEGGGDTRPPSQPD